MSKTVLEQSLQLILQESTATAVVAVLLTAGLVGMSIRTIIESVVTDEERVGDPIGDGGTTGVASTSPAQRGDDSPEALESTENQRTSVDDGDETDEELEYRLDELEEEVDTLSSTVKTVRNENEQISSSVKDIEENTGRLLNLYQMATRGVNPFAGNDPAESSAVGESSAVEQPKETDSFSKEDEIEEIETEVADSDAADLFDSGETEKPIREEHCVDSVEEVVDAGGETEDAFQQARQEPQVEDDGPVEEEVSDEAFEAVFETKTVETESKSDESSETFGKEEMIDAGGDETAPAASDGGQLIEPPEDTAEPESSKSNSEPAPESARSAVESAESAVEPDTTTEDASEQTATVTPTREAEAESHTELKGGPDSQIDETSPETDGSSAGIVEQATKSAGTAASSDLKSGKPYVDSLPDGFATELMTVEWLEYLVEEVGIRGTVRALDYYETIGWLTEDAVAELDTYLDAFEEPEATDLSVEHHLRSLDYVEELEHAEEQS